MIKALLSRAWAWFWNKAVPYFGDVAEEWWLNAGDKPRATFVSMVAGWLLIETLLYALT